MAAAVVVALLAVGGALLLLGRPAQPSLGGPSPSPSPSLTSTPLPTPAGIVASPPSGTPSQTSRSFVSPGNGYSVTIPAHWSTRAASARWNVGATLSWGDNVVDELHTTNVRLSVGSKPLPAGQTPSGMIQSMFAETRACTSVLPAPATVPVGDSTGTVIINGCSVANKPGAMDPRGYDWSVGVVSGGRVYYFLLDGSVDPAYLEALLATVKLDPASAN